jgi:hypothetical protein
LSDEVFLRVLLRFQQRLRVASAATAVLLASAATGAVLGVSNLALASSTTARTAALVTFASVAAALMWGAWRRWTPAHVALAVEARARSLDNLVVTAEAIACGRAKAPHRIVAGELFAVATTRLAGMTSASVQPLGRVVVMAVLSLVGVGFLFVVLPARPQPEDTASRGEREVSQVALSPGDLRVIVTPPSYVNQGQATLMNPTSLTVLEGSRVRLEVSNEGTRTRIPVLHEVDGRQTAFQAAESLAILEFVATTSRPLLVRSSDTGLASDRLVHLRVEADGRPAVMLREPAKDLMFAEAAGQVSVQVDARDDIALQSLSLRYTRVSGAGETFTFEEGEWPIEINKDGAQAWRGRAVLSLERLKLQDGDTLVYRAIARDAKPGADPSSSDTYLIEIGRLAGVASTGFALPEERDRQAISQQMLIIKTERLHVDRNKLTADTFAEQAQLLAVEQRMVKAEFVFMTGGEVEDEVEEAASAHELAEGRSENSGQVELLTAIREMSRAEARLNAADTARALDFERAALKALQRAFDRRRYLLRTLPERARIDVARRLTGELNSARSSTLARDIQAADSTVENARALLAELNGAHSTRGTLAPLASRMLGLEAQSEELQQAALQLSAAADDTARMNALRVARAAIVDVLRAHLARQAATPLTREPLKGRLVEELTTRGLPR